MRIGGSLRLISALVAISGSVAHSEEVLVGVPLPMTGALASYVGSPLKAGIDVAVERANQRGLLGSGRTIKSLVEDFASDKAQAVALVTRFATRDNVSIIVGPPTSGPALAAAPVANVLMTPLLGLAYSDDVARAGPWSFKVNEKPSKGNEIIARYALEKLKTKRIAVVYDKTNDGAVSVKDGFVNLMKAGGAEIVSEDAFVTADTNFSAIATKVVDKAPDTLFLAAGTPDAGANFMIQVRQAGLPANTKIIGISALGAAAYTRIGGKAVDGTIYATDFFPGVDTPEYRDFVAAYKQKTGNVPDIFAALGNVGMALAAEAVRLAGPGATRDEIRKSLTAIRDLPVAFGTGKVAFTPERITSYDLVIVRIDSGGAVVVQ